MPTAVGPNTKGEENLVFGYDLGDTVNSYKGMPVHNIIRPLDDWELTSRLNIEEVSGSNWDTPVPGARMWKCYYSSSIAVNSLTRDTNSYNSLILSGSFGKSMYVYSMWVRGFDTNPSNSSISIDVHDRNITSTTLNDNTWKKVSLINTVEHTGYPNYLFHDLYVDPTDSTKVDFLITGLMLARYSGSSYQDLTPITTTNVQWLPEGSLREVDESLVDLTGNSTIDLSNVSFDSNAQMTFDGTDDYIDNILIQSSSAMTWEAVVYPESLSRNVFLNGFNPRISLRNYQINLYHTKPDRDGDIGFTYNFQGGRYYHIVVTYDSSNGYRGYVNAEEKTRTIAGNGAAGKPEFNSTKVGISAGSEGYFDGKIPLAKIYNRALTALEIKSNYNAIKGRFNI